MANSFYASELTATQQQTARGHREDGTPITENRRYAELSAMGLWTTPTDYVQFVRSVLDARTADGGIISKKLAQGATTSQYGMRSLVFHFSENGQLYFGGNFYGYYFTMAANPSADWVSVAGGGLETDKGIERFAHRMHLPAWLRRMDVHPMRRTVKLAPERSSSQCPVMPSLGRRVRSFLPPRQTSEDFTFKLANQRQLGNPVL
jgi:hypothetical protein